MDEIERTVRCPRGADPFGKRTQRVEEASGGFRTKYRILGLSPSFSTSDRGEYPAIATSRMTTLLTADATAAQLDDRILDAVHRWHVRGEAIDDTAFNALALDIFRYQAGTCEPYGRFARARGFSPSELPAG